MIEPEQSLFSHIPMLSSTTPHPKLEPRDCGNEMMFPSRRPWTNEWCVKHSTYNRQTNERHLTISADVNANVY